MLKPSILIILVGEFMTIEELKKLQNQIIEKEKKYNLIGGITYLALIIPSIIMMIIWKSDYFSIINIFYLLRLFIEMKALLLLSHR